MLSATDKDQERPWYLVCFALLDRSLYTFGQAPGEFVALALLFYAPAFALSWIELPFDQWITTPLCVLVWSACFMLTTAAASAVVSHLRSGTKASVANSLSVLFGGIVPLASTVLVGAILEAVGVVALVVPAIVVGFWTVFAGPACVQEGLNGWRALQRARALVGDYRWLQVGAVLLMAAAVRVLVGMLPVSGIGTYLMFSHNRSLFSECLMVGWTALVDVFLLAVASAWVGAAYYDAVDAKSSGTLDPP